MTLTDQERQLTHTLFSQGPSALLDVGYTLESIKDFLAREDVLAELGVLQTELDFQPEIQARTRFLARRQLAQLLPGASAVLARALAGPVYARDEKGQILIDANGNPIMLDVGATPLQLKAAEIVMDQTGVGDHKESAHAGKMSGFNPQRMLEEAQEAVVVRYADEQVTEEQRALSRERVRLAFEQLKGVVGPARQKALEAFDAHAETTRRGAKLKRSSPKKRKPKKPHGGKA